MGTSTLLAVALALIQMTGTVSSYTVRGGDSLWKLGARFGVSASVIAAQNGLNAESRLQIGQVLTFDNRHIVADMSGMDIIVNVPQRMLFWNGQDASVQGIPVAAGKRDWKTPMGDFTITTRETDPTWHVPPSIQEEMRKEGRPVLTHVPPSPANPLGKYWLGLSIPGVGIHGTNAPSSVYGLVSHGCIRLHPDDIEALFPRVVVGMRGRIVYEPTLILHDGTSVFLEVHPDVYHNGGDPLAFVMERAKTGGYAEMLDLPLVREVIRKHEGVARNITRR